MASRQASWQHPWLAKFAASPLAMLDELLKGHADIHPYQRLDVPDAVLRLFGGLDQDDPKREALNVAVMAWLAERRSESLPTSRPLLQRYIREVAEALEIVSLLGLASATVALRHGFIIWNEWVSRLVLSQSRDARAVYWRTLALTQPLVAEHAKQLDPYGLAAIWQQICREAGGEFPRHYLSIGLLGLRRLPADDIELPWLSGLAQWAKYQKPSDAEFKAEWYTLKSLYPRSAAHWRKAVDQVLSAPTFADFDAPAWWHVDPDFTAMSRKHFRRTSTPLRSPLPDEAQRIAQRIKHDPLDSVLSAVTDLVRRHRHFLNSTGDPSYFVRAVHLIGTALITSHDRRNTSARIAQSLAREGLKWDPRNAYLLSLWQLALTAEGRLEFAELVGWEAIRRNPDYPHARNQLATLLTESLGRAGEAEVILRETIERFPDDSVPRNQLAKLLLDWLDRPEEAETILLETIARFPDDAVARSQLATLIAETLSRADEAETVLRETIERFPGSAVPRSQLAKLLEESLGRPDEAEKVLRDAIERFPETPAPRSQLARLLAETLGRPDQAEQVLREAAADFPHDEIIGNQLGLLLKRYPGNRAPALDKPDVPAAGSVASTKQFNRALSELLGQAPQQSEIGRGDRAESGIDSRTGPSTMAARPEGSPPAIKQEPGAPLGPPAGEILPIPSTEATQDAAFEKAMKMGKLRKIRFKLENLPTHEHQACFDELRSLFSEDEHSGYARLLAARFLGSMEHEYFPSVAIAFEAALGAEDQQRLEHLAERQPRLSALILVGRALFGDREAEERIATLLGKGSSQESSDLQQGLRVVLRPVLRLIQGGQSVGSALGEHRRPIESALRDANEALLEVVMLAA